jgi:hypothetical protein
MWMSFRHLVWPATFALKINMPTERERRIFRILYLGFRRSSHNATSGQERRNGINIFTWPNVIPSTSSWIARNTKQWEWRRSEQFARRIKKSRKRQSSTKGTKTSYEELLLHILRQKKIGDTDVDKYDCFLLSLLHSGSLTANKFSGSNGISQNIRNVRFAQNLDTYSTCFLFPVDTKILSLTTHNILQPIQ